MRIAFVSTLTGGGWGGSEILWSRAATRMAAMGHKVVASIDRLPSGSSELSRLSDAGVKVFERGKLPNLLCSLLHKRVVDILRRGLSLKHHRRWLSQNKVDLICISNSCYADDTRLLKLSKDSGMPYVLVAQANGEQMWPEDQRARSIIEIYTNAKRAFFVSERNCKLLETQLGMNLPNTEVVRNPFNVKWNPECSWPGDITVPQFACVGRLDPRSKGQDLILRVVAQSAWSSREFSISFFGKGEMEEGIRRLAEQLGLLKKVKFCGHVGDIENIWKTHHALVLPSRYEGLPIAIVEAMLCNRPVITTDVAGNCELMQDNVTGFVAEAPTFAHLSLAMERAWTCRGDWEKIGIAAGEAARKCVPSDPVGEFVQKLFKAAQ